MSAKNWICLLAVAIAAFGGMAQGTTMTIENLLVNGAAIKTDGTFIQATRFYNGDASDVTAFGITWAHSPGSPPVTFNGTQNEGGSGTDKNGVAFTGSALTLVSNTRNINYGSITQTFSNLTVGSAYRVQFITSDDHPSRMETITFNGVSTGEMSGKTWPTVVTYDWTAGSTSAAWTIGGSSGKAVGFALYQEVPEPENLIPEPATLALLGLGVAGLGGYVRRRRG